MKKLTLRIDKAHYQAVLDGSVKVEERFVYPNNSDRYVVEAENADGAVTINPVHYDCIEYICGRGDKTKKMTVKVDDAAFIILTDENGDDLTYEENGEIFVVCQVWYYLGAVEANA